MTTLMTSAFLAVTAKLFTEAAASDAQLKERMRASGDPGTPITLPEDYRALYGSLKDFHLAVSRETARLLYMLVRSSRARTIVEFGTSFGVSTLHLAAALRDNGGGRLISTEFEPTKVARARANLSATGLDDLVEIRVGDALETLARDLPEGIDLVLLDGAKNLYLTIALPSRAAAQVWLHGAGRQCGLESGVSCPRTGRGRRLFVRPFRQRGRTHNETLSRFARLACSPAHQAGSATPCLLEVYVALIRRSRMRARGFVSPGTPNELFPEGSSRRGETRIKKGSLRPCTGPRIDAARSARRQPG